MNLTDDKSIYLQIEKTIEDNILRGVFDAEEKVPSTNELSKLYTINPATAAKGVNQLVEKGILYKKRGIGMFVSSSAKDIISTNRKNLFYQNFIVSLMREAKSLNITNKELSDMLLKAESDKTI